MSKNKQSGLFLEALSADCRLMGGQALIEGVMMRNGDVYGVAIRRPDGGIYTERLPWRRLDRWGWLSAPFVRGFPILVESVVNGARALELSAWVADGGPDLESAGRLWLSLGAAIVAALALFVGAPHFLSFLMFAIGLGNDVNGASFHFWDGAFKCAIFILYIQCISLAPEIRRVFEYHGAEHKTICAWERGHCGDAAAAFGMSRLHPRCGTTFLLFVICVTIVVQALALPALFTLWEPGRPALQHGLSIALKLALIPPVSAIAYELIRIVARMRPGVVRDLLQWPGLALQRLTTREPTLDQLEVAEAALREAIGARGDELRIEN